MVRVSPAAPSSTSWWATRPRRRTECTRTPSTSAPRAPSAASRPSRPASARCRPRGGRPRPARRCAARCREGASALSGWCSSMTSTDSKNGAACCGEPHHQHRADREVRRDEHADAGRVGQPGATGRQPRVVEAGGADDGVDAVRRRRTARLSITDVGVGEVDHHLGAGVDDAAARSSPRRPGGDQLEVVGAASTARHTSGPSGPRRRARRPGSARHRPVHRRRRRRSRGPRRTGRRPRASARSASRSAATCCTSSSVTALDPRQHLVDAEQLAVDQLGLAEPAHPRAGVLQAEHQPAAQLALAALELLVGDAAGATTARAARGRSPAPRRPCSGRQPA